MIAVIQDRIGQSVKVNDVVYSYNDIYIVKAVGRTTIKALLKNPSPTTRPKSIHCKDFVVITKLLKE